MSVREPRACRVIYMVAYSVYFECHIDCFLKIYELYQTEVTKTNERILEALGIGMKLKELCAHNRMVKDLFTGSVVITFNCPTLYILKNSFQFPYWIHQQTMPVEFRHVTSLKKYSEFINLLMF